MQVNQALKWGATELRGFDNPRLEAEVLLMHALGWDRAKLYANLESEADVEVYQTLIQQRRAHMPAAYLTGKREFCGFEFEIGPAVLIPRPTTESLVYRAIELIKQHHYKLVHDIGTGSGNIAISVAKLAPEVRVIASDIDAPSLATARANAKRLQVDERIDFVKSHLADHIGEAGLIIANLPYVPDFMEVSPEVAQEPRPAIFSPTNDGLGFYRELFESKIFHGRVGQVLIELRPQQYATMSDWLAQRYPKIKITPIRDIDGEIWGLEADFSECDA